MRHTSGIDAFELILPKKQPLVDLLRPYSSMSVVKIDDSLGTDVVVPPIVRIKQFLTVTLKFFVLGAYTLLNTHYPYVWDTLKFGCLYTGAELTQQIMIKKVMDSDFKMRSWNSDREDLDWDSVFRYALWGFAVFPHILRRWYRFLDSQFEGNSWKAVMQKTFVDQAIFPVPILAAFYIFLSLMEGKTSSWQVLTEECRMKLGATLTARYCFMIPTQFINFAFISPNNRVFYSGITMYFWLNILCVFKRIDMNSAMFTKKA